MKPVNVPHSGDVKSHIAFWYSGTINQTSMPKSQIVHFYNKSAMFLTARTWTPWAT